MCNYVSRIIDPITSRTAKFRFRLLPSEIQRRQIDMIVEKENVNISQNGIDKLIEGKNHLINSEYIVRVYFIFILVAGGDMRRAITYLQSLHRLNPDEIAPNDVFEIAAMCDDEKVNGIIKAAQEISFDKMIIKAKELLLVRNRILKTVINLMTVITLN